MYKCEKMQYITDSEICNLILPTSLCIYQNKKTYLMVEVNTGCSKGSLKVISKSYDNITELLKDKNVITSQYPLLQNCIIYNDKIMSAL